MEFYHSFKLNMLNQYIKILRISQSQPCHFQISLKTTSDSKTLINTVLLFLNFPSNGQFIVAGSDDGSFFIWERSTSNIVRVLKGDNSIVNCLQPHPTTCVLATSGIDKVVRLWAPQPEVSDIRRIIYQVNSLTSILVERRNILIS